MSDESELSEIRGKNWQPWLFGSVVALVLLGLFIQNKIVNNRIDECPRYVVGYTYDTGRRNITYRYSIGGSGYTNNWDVNPRSVKEYIGSDFYPKKFIGQRFLVRCNCKTPKSSEIIWTHAIPENITSAPVDGWVTIPSDFPKTEFAD